jgi:predicted transcriptional regulator
MSYSVAGWRDKYTWAYTWIMPNLSVYVSTELAKLLDDSARKRGMSRSALAREYLKAELDRLDAERAQETERHLATAHDVP